MLVFVVTATIRFSTPSLGYLIESGNRKSYIKSSKKIILFNFRFHHSILSKYIMLLRNMARMSIARNSKAFIHSSRVCAEESQMLVKKAAEGKFNL